MNPYYENFIANYFPIPSDAPVINIHDPKPYFFKFVFGLINFHMNPNIFKHLNNPNIPIIYNKVYNLGCYCMKSNII